MQGGTKTCPRCGSVNEAAAAVCTGCGHEFGAGAEDDPTPRIIADGSDAPRSGSAAARPGRILSIAILSVVVLIFGFVILVFLNVSRSIDDVGSILPTPDVIEEEIFTAESCTEEVGDAIESLLTAQARGEPLDDVLEGLPFPSGSFEYRTAIAVFADVDVQSALVAGNERRAIRLARRAAEEACRGRYGP